MILSSIVMCLDSSSFVDVLVHLPAPELSSMHLQRHLSLPSPESPQMQIQHLQHLIESQNPSVSFGEDPDPADDQAEHLEKGVQKSEAQP